MTTDNVQNPADVIPNNPAPSLHQTNLANVREVVASNVSVRRRLVKCPFGDFQL